MGRSTSPTGPFVDKNGKNMRIIGSTSGGTVVLRHDDSRGLEDRYYGPGHLSLFREKGVDYLSFHYYNPNGYYPSAEANYKGRPTLGLAKVEWDEDGWPAISFDFLDEGIYSMTNTNSGKVMDVYSHTVRSGAELFQYARDTALDSQKWLFTSLGTGEYTIRNYADPNQYIEIPGDGTSEYLEITSDYVGGINQKFRVVEDISGKFMIYPSIRDEIMEIPFAYTNDYRIRLFDNTNHDCQRWYPAMFEETFSVSDDRLIIEYDESENYEIEISSNGSWTVQVADTSWLKTTPGYGTGNSLLGILSEKNPNSEIRTNIITLKSNGGQEFELYVYQKANETGVQENNVSPVFLYPNPCDGIIRIQGNSIMDISVANINGLELFKQSGYVPGESLDFSGLHTGIYIVRITTPNGSKSLRLLKH